MLVLTRKPGEAIILDGGIRIVVVSSDRRGVRLGIEAPLEIAVLREELVQQIAAANLAARPTEDVVAAIPSALRGAVTPG